MEEMITSRHSYGEELINFLAGRHVVVFVLCPCVGSVDVWCAPILFCAVVSLLWAMTYVVTRVQLSDCSSVFVYIFFVSFKRQASALLA
ncbi:hypothetical protein B0T17DRAFT_522118 [Bombardia bombarda]|uniref:Uncharacterized protein n=1 Tax=Bombardia bombarda TaxID=252184 RepID=A0AA40C7B0_9PEZI|nr:hypothetical protein B0T17DRAFT_522118 [Bombardia bombarda]